MHARRLWTIPDYSGIRRNVIPGIQTLEFRNAWDNDVIDDIMAVRLLVREDAYRGAYSCGSLLTETLIRAGTRLLVHPRHVYITRPQPEGNP
jgi:hypothetical protein